MKHNRKTIFEALGRHPVHPFPARMAPGIALAALSESPRPLRVLDPMMGSGTVLAVARAHGHSAMGVDMDPLAVLLTRVWTTPIDQEEMLETGAEVLGRAKARYTGLSIAQAYPDGSDEETRAFIRYWFDEHARKQLASLAHSIQRVRDENIKSALWCAFSRLIITKSFGASLAMDLSHSRPHKSFLRAPAKPFQYFLPAVEIVAANCLSSKSKSRGPRIRVNLGDARSLVLDAASIDLILTSPPYLNAIDYIRCSKFSLVWMGHTIDELSATRSASVGAEASSEEALDDSGVRSIMQELKLRPALSNRNNAILARYVWDMRRALREAARVLVRNGRAIYVVGDSTVRGTFIRNSEIVRATGEVCGLTLHQRRSRTLPANRRYLPPPKSGNGQAPMDNRMREEVILTFTK